MELTCAVLDDKENTRVLTATSIFTAFQRARKGANDRLQIDGTNIPPFLAAKNLEPFIDKDLLQWTKPIKYRDANKIEYGYNARILPGMCKMYLEARRKGGLVASQDKLAIQSEILLSALSDIGIIALVDEASGFQFNRKYDALRILLSKYVEEGIQKWIKRFPDKFFEELDRLYDNKKTTSRSRPPYYGKFINDHIYKPIENGYLKAELDKKNIKVDGKRIGRFHQWLTEFGASQLTMQVGRTLGVMEISPNLRKFKENIERQKGLSIQPDLFENEES